MSLIRIATLNLLESATTITDSGTPTTGYPVTRLYDRNVARQMRIATAGARDWTFTGGVDAISVNALILAAGHNVGGLAYTLGKSANGTDWTTVSTGTLPAGTGVIVIEFAATTGAYWKLTLPNDTNAIITEMLLTYILTVDRNPARPSGALETGYNVRKDETSAGSPRYLEYGPSRRRRAYEWPGGGGATLSAATAAAIKSMTDALGGTKPFFICDHAGAWIWGDLETPVAPAEATADRRLMTFDFREAL